MSETVQVGSILMKEWPGMPQMLGFETEPWSGEWSLVKMLNGFALDRKIHAAGWNFFFMAPEIKAMFLGFLAPVKIQSALKRILAQVDSQHFNGLEVTEIAARRFLGVPYGTVSAHCRQIQQSSSLDSSEARRTSQNDAAWARG
ncbi:MAG TPA: hypothetical protein VGG04_09225 [Candidatus Sulfotelmatobacter sp.]